MLRAAPHLVDIYRRSASGQSLYTETLSTWGLVAQDVPFDVQLTTGEVEQRQYGQVAVAGYESYLPHGIDLRPGDGIIVKASESPAVVGRRFMTLRSMDWGDRGGVQAQVEDTEEMFGDEDES